MRSAARCLARPMLQRAGASAAARDGVGQLLLFQLHDLPLPTCTRWHGARMHDAQPVLTHLPALPITQGSRSSCTLCSAELQASCAPKCRQHGEPGRTSRPGRLERSRLDGRPCSRMRWRCTSAVLLSRVWCSGGAERSEHRHERSRGVWARMHPQRTPVLEEGGPR